ncbi:DUF6153 family protein [Pseudonocardia asaccharolytica]|uniref:Uncharacterized protein n=1 Tax=Pseudonocardia asaccharolytica DSM 44247 = NBRC 16224 TaxID=1123024 RepID=A0A511D348_9PSEU|nr:DUF6153 family protein [Pseudonocardia asaccharolytica]GEL17328.1 hypothetical protein PA7_11650 [Pseudonocardia asaccharolytica DSM 44247 = NBRC 16224]
MDGAGRWRIERLLVVAALALGVLAMHSTPAPVEDTTPHVMAAAAPGPVPAPALPVAAPADHPGQPGHGQDPATHHVLDVCLAVLGAAVLLAAAAAPVWVCRRAAAAGAQPPGTALPCVPRPPPPLVIRLAELCVLRR